MTRLAVAAAVAVVVAGIAGCDPCTILGIPLSDCELYETCESDDDCADDEFCDNAGNLRGTCLFIDDDSGSSG